MAKYERVNKSVFAFGEGAGDGKRYAFGTSIKTDDINDNLNTSFKAGWGTSENSYPTITDFNGKDYTLSYLLSYLYQQGIAEYNANQNYYIGSFCVYNNIIYRSLTGTNDNPNIGNSPIIKSSWKNIFEDYANINGNIGNTFNVAPATAGNHAVNLSQLNAKSSDILYKIGSLKSQTDSIKKDFIITSDLIGRLLICDSGVNNITLPLTGVLKSGDLIYISNEKLDDIDFVLNGNNILLTKLPFIRALETVVLQYDGGNVYRFVYRSSNVPCYHRNGETLSHNTIYQASQNLRLIVNLKGVYRNGIKILAGHIADLSLTANVVGQVGDDINSNTKYATLIADINAGDYFKTVTDFTDAWEEISLNVYYCK